MKSCVCTSSQVTFISSLYLEDLISLLWLLVVIRKKDVHKLQANIVNLLPILRLSLFVVGVDKVNGTKTLWSDDLSTSNFISKALICNGIAWSIHPKRFFEEDSLKLSMALLKLLAIFCCWQMLGIPGLSNLSSSGHWTSSRKYDWSC